ncbi:MAG TPA: hypothetical protein PL009_10995 [Flavipsychrobacter sp.]|nr:hypothetical protein [Flavipsychrobacter sp.]
MKLTVVTLALVSNYLISWNYDDGNEDHVAKQDTVVVPASHKYSRMNPLKWFFLGKNYREEWSTPVKMPVFHLTETKGGFTIEKLGGGEQTKSLHLVNKNGTEWVARSVDKNVRGALPENLQGTFIQRMVQDQISAAYPYAILTMYDLSKAVDIPTPTAELYYIPDDPALGKYRPTFAHSIVFLSPKDIDGKDLKTESTDSIKTLIHSSNYYQLQQEKILTARLFDMLIADWDRHKGQWDWAFIDSGHTIFIYPVPEDRDQAFFLSQGAITQVARLFGLPHLIGFKENPKKLKKLNNKVHDFDRFYMNRLDRNNWKKSILDFQAKMTDDVIEKAVSRLPREVHAISGNEIKQKLISRRNGLLKEGLRYYDFLAEEAVISSTKDPELFTIYNYSDSTTVVVTRAKDGRKIYERTFYSDETDEININNIGEEDKIEASGKPSIKINYHKLDAGKATDED